MEGVGRSVIDDGDSRDRLVVPFRPGVHALPSCAGVVDESGFSDLPEEAIVAKSSSDPHTEYRWGVLCMLRHNMFVEGVGFILPPEAICVLLSSVVGVVGSLSNVDVTTTTAGDLVRHALSPTSAITGNTNRTLIPLRRLATSRVKRV